mgnify:CR=1 FL=1
MTTRPAAVAGLFYQGAPQRLQAEVETLLAGAQAPGALRPRALIVPHAGYRYSGTIAADAYRQLTPFAASYRQVVVLGPAHRVYVDGVAAPSVDSFSTPLGEVPLAAGLLRRALQHPVVTCSDEAHRHEHSLEVHLPFLQAVLADFTVLPLLVGRCPPETVAFLLDDLPIGPDTLIVISTDLSHFHDYRTARAMDERTCQRILDGATDLRGEEACGAAPVNGFLASQLGRSMQCELLSRCNSGDSSGDHSRVVGYAAFTLH